jgi:hypothetical protein
LVLEPVSKTPVVILKPFNDNKIIPIWIGEYEANAITMELENIAPPRPMTHDLINDILASLNSKVEKVVITDIVDNTYYADLYIRRGSELSVVDCRPSDAISVALKNSAKIYISELVYRSAVLSDFISHFAHSEERLEQWFDSLSSEDFGNVEQ